MKEKRVSSRDVRKTVRCRTVAIVDDATSGESTHLKWRATPISRPWVRCGIHVGLGGPIIEPIHVLTPGLVKRIAHLLRGDRLFHLLRFYIVWPVVTDIRSRAKKPAPKIIPIGYVSKPQWIAVRDRIPSCICVGRPTAAGESDRIAFDVSADCGVIIPEVVVVRGNRR
jgi:hypothetical protein